jgi:hypothetical protein
MPIGEATMRGIPASLSNFATCWRKPTVPAAGEATGDGEMMGVAMTAELAEGTGVGLEPPGKPGTPGSTTLEGRTMVARVLGRIAGRLGRTLIELAGTTGREMAGVDTTIGVALGRLGIPALTELDATAGAGKSGVSTFGSILLMILGTAEVTTGNATDSTGSKMPGPTDGTAGLANTEDTATGRPEACGKVEMTGTGTPGVGSRISDSMEPTKLGTGVATGSTSDTTDWITPGTPVGLVITDSTAPGRPVTTGSTSDTTDSIIPGAPVGSTGRLESIDSTRLGTGVTIGTTT